MGKRKPTHADLRPICTIPELAPAMGLSVSTVRRMVTDQVIPKSCTVNIGKGAHVRLFTERLRAADILPKLTAVAS